MNIKIEKKSVIDELHRQTALLALKNEKDENIVYSEDDADRVEPLWKASLGELLQLFVPYATMEMNDDNALFTLTLPSNRDTSHGDTLQQLATSHVTMSLTARWLDNVKPDSAMLLRSLNTSTANAITEILYRTKRP
ncbi:MAG: hypothetical protein IKZ18_03565 [Bacteroidaceae bacterium]|nr:hypothetical protein [Bacteroidaceae bacterium]